MKTRFTFLIFLLMVPLVMLSACLQYPDVHYYDTVDVVDVADVVDVDHGQPDVVDADGDAADVADAADVPEVDGEIAEFCVKDKLCDDKNGCTVEDKCNEVGECVGRVVEGCDDSLECTEDSCLSDSECTHLIKENFCFVAGKCYVADELDLEGAGPCRKCKPDVADDEMTADDTLTCDDASMCTTGDHCDSGVCNGTVLVCDDQNVCTDDSCDPASGCLEVNNTVECVPARCDAKTFYAAAVCADGICPTPVPENCDDANPCTEDTCKASTGCSHTLRNGLECAPGRCDLGTYYAPAFCQNDFCPPQDSEFCDDGDICTQDSCSPQGGCLTPPANGVECAAASCDGLTFYARAVCAAGSCPGQVTQNCNDNNVCTSDTCELTGCKNTANTLDCADANLCTENDKCQNKTCKPGPSKNCDDGLACTIDSCAASTGICAHNHPGYCVIDNQCYVDGQPNPANPCQICSVAVSSTTWSPGQNGYLCADYPYGGAECLGGECIYSCDLNRGDCDLDPENGCEANLLNDPDYCADCFTDCGTQVCSWGTCADSCAGDLVLCDNRCEDIKTSLENCGNCNVPCDLDNAAEACVNGVCNLTLCDNGYVDVDHIKDNGCECHNTGIELCDGVDNDCNGATDDVASYMVQEDPVNCGVCGKICNEGDTTVYGICRDASCINAPCSVNEWDINKNPLDVCEYQCQQVGIEICGNSIDEDCSGTADDGCV